MPSKNLWGDLSKLKIVRTPKAILLEQAQHLAKATGGLLEAEIDARRTQRRHFDYNFDIVVPALNDYRYTLLQISHDIKLYPVVLAVGTLDVKYECIDAEAFEAALKNAFSEPRVTLILSRLLSQAKD